MIKMLVNSLYQLQKMRIQFGNRLCASFYIRNGVKPGKVPDDFLVKWAEKVGYPLEKDDDGAFVAPEMIEIIMYGYRKIIVSATPNKKKPRKSDMIAALPSREIFAGNGIITNHTDAVLIQSLVNLEMQEDLLVKEMNLILPNEKIFPWMKEIRGLGPQLSGIIISEIDIHKAETVSKIWKYAGLDCLPNGEGRSRKEGHLVERAFVNKDGEEDTRMSITFNPFLKTKLIGVLGTSFIRLNNPVYRKIYDDYKNRIALREALLPKEKQRCKKHINAMAIRYMIKQFLRDLYMAWRAIEGLPITEEYAVRKLGLVHHAS